MRMSAPLMKLIKQLGFLRLGADASKPKLEVDDDRVMHLFRNRAELKKAHGSLQDEVQRVLTLGATHIRDVDESGYQWSTLADPEDNEFDIVATPE